MSDCGMKNQMREKRNFSDPPNLSAKARYAVLLLVAECLGENSSEHRRFIGRVIRRIARLLWLDHVSYLAFRAQQRLSRCIQTSAGSVVAARFPRWLWATRGLENRDYLRSWIQRRYDNGPKIIVLGMGSIGDILQITPLLAALRERFPAAETGLLHRSTAARTVLLGNRNIDSISLAHSYDFELVKEAVRKEGGADLVVEIEGITCIVTYTCAPLTLRHPDLAKVFTDSFFAQAAAAQRRCKLHHPLSASRLTKWDQSELTNNVHYLEVLGATANLPINRYSRLDFFPQLGDASAVNLLALKKPYVTVQNGVDTDVMKWSRVTGRRPTKLLPATTWRETVELLRAEDLTVIQLGTKDDEQIEGADMDLRGRTTLGQAAVILKSAVCHVGIEGGLVHLARALDVKSVVAFGPTSSTFLGYPQNTNLVASDCNSCWWTTEDWHTHCPRGMAGPPCMDAHTAAMIAQAVRRIQKGQETQ